MSYSESKRSTANKSINLKYKENLLCLQTFVVEIS